MYMHMYMYTYMYMYMHMYVYIWIYISACMSYMRGLQQDPPRAYGGFHKIDFEKLPYEVSIGFPKCKWIEEINKKSIYMY